MRVKVDRELCVGIGNCVAVAPEVFKLDEENKAVVVDPAGAAEKTIRLAAGSCPVSAIILEDDNGRQLYP
jgi:ferredoxin